MPATQKLIIASLTDFVHMSEEDIRARFSSQNAYDALKILQVSPLKDYPRKAERIDAVIKFYKSEHEKYIENRLLDKYEDELELEDFDESDRSAAIHLVKPQGLPTFILELKNRRSAVYDKSPKEVADELHAELLMKKYYTKANKPLSSIYIANKITTMLIETVELLSRRNTGDKIIDGQLNDIGWTANRWYEFRDEFKKGNVMINIRKIRKRNSDVDVIKKRAPNEISGEEAIAVIDWAKNIIEQFNPDDCQGRKHLEAALAFGILTGRRISEIYEYDAIYWHHELGIACDGLSKKNPYARNAAIFPPLADAEMLLNFINTFPMKESTPRATESATKKLSEKRLGHIPEWIRNLGFTSHSKARKFFGSFWFRLFKHYDLADQPSEFMVHVMCHEKVGTHAGYLTFRIAIEKNEYFDRMAAIGAEYIDNITVASKEVKYSEKAIVPLTVQV